jgi:hypothetical protein
MVRWRFIIFVVIVCAAVYPLPMQARLSSATIGACPIFPPDNPWNRDISNRTLIASAE